MSYSEASVRALIDRATIPVKINNQEESQRDVIARYHHIWTPDIRILTGEGEELYRWNGYLPPAEFTAQILVALGHAQLRLRRFPEAIELYDEALRRFPTAIVAPEAQYFAAVSAYRKSGEGSDLMKGWHQLEERYPGTEWATKQNFD